MFLDYFPLKYSHIFPVFFQKISSRTECSQLLHLTFILLAVILFCSHNSYGRLKLFIEKDEHTLTHTRPLTLTSVAEQMIRLFRCVTFHFSWCCETTGEHSVLGCKLSMSKWVFSPTISNPSVWPLYPHTLVVSWDFSGARKDIQFVHLDIIPRISSSVLTDVWFILI